jgi:hypothetical protein
MAKALKPHIKHQKRAGKSCINPICVLLIFFAIFLISSKKIPGQYLSEASSAQF